MIIEDAFYLAVNVEAQSTEVRLIGLVLMTRALVETEAPIEQAEQASEAQVCTFFCTRVVLRQALAY